MKYQKRYEAVRIDDSEPIGPLRIPIVPPGVDPDKILPFIIDQLRRDREQRKTPYIPLRIPEKQDPIQ